MNVNLKFDDVEKEIMNQILHSINNGEDNEFALKIEESPILHSSVASNNILVILVVY